MTARRHRPRCAVSKPRGSARWAPAELPGSLDEVTWTARIPRLALVPGVVFFGTVAVGLWHYAADASIIEDRPPVLTVVGIGMGAMAALVTAFLVVAGVASVQGCWLRLDADGFTYRGRGFPRPAPPARYRWVDCRPFRVVRITGAQTLQVQCRHPDGSFTLDAEFGDATDIATILNAYLSIYGDPREAFEDFEDAAALPDRTLRGPRRDHLIPLLFVGACSGLIAALFAFADGSTAEKLIFGAIILMPCGLALSVLAMRVVNPPWLCLDSSGLTHGGFRGLWPTRPRRYRWQDCSAFSEDNAGNTLSRSAGQPM